MKQNARVMLFSAADQLQPDIIEESRRVWAENAYVFDSDVHSRRMICRVPMDDLLKSKSSTDECLRAIMEALGEGLKDGSVASARSLVVGAMHPGGFDIHLFVSGLNIVGDFGGLLQDFDDLPSAIDWVRKAISGNYRLHMEKVHGRVRRWTLEPVADSHDKNDVLVCGHASWFHKFKHVEHVYRQNRHLRLCD